MSTVAESPTRSGDLSATLENMLQAHVEWSLGEEKNLSRELCDAIETAVEVWNSGDIPGELRRLAPRMEKLEKEWTTWLMQADTGDGKDVPAPESGHALWVTMALLTKEKDQNDETNAEPIKYVEPIAMLIEQKVPHRQICKLYRARWEAGAKDGPGLWDNARDQPMLARLFKEIKTPGSILGENADEFIPFETVERLEKEQAQRKAAAHAAAQMQKRRAKAAGPDQTPLEELVAEGVSGEQIARMKHITVDEVERQCREASLPVPQRTYGVIKVGEGKFDQEPADVDAQERIQAARANAHQNRAKIEQLKVEKPAKPLVSELPKPSQDFGGDPDEEPEGTDPADMEDQGEEPGAEFSEGQGTPRVSDLERQVAEIVQSGVTKPKEIAERLGGTHDWQTIRNVVGKLKGDPMRMAEALKP